MGLEGYLKHGLQKHSEKVQCVFAWMFVCLDMSASMKCDLYNACVFTLQSG